MGDMIEQPTKPGGPIICYMMKDFTPADRDTAEMLKLIYPNGKIVFAVPTRNEVGEGNGSWDVRGGDGQ